MSETRKLKPEELAHVTDPDSLGFNTTDELAVVTATFGQKRGVDAIEFGLGMRVRDFNIYVAGKPGTGRNTRVFSLVRVRSMQEAAPPDWVYVHNFSDPYRPRAISLEPGRGPEFARDMEDFVKTARVELPKAFESENYSKRRDGIVDVVQKRRDALLEELQKRASEMSFTVEATAVGIASVPLNQEGKPYSREEYEAASEKQKRDVKQRGATLQESINQFVTRGRALEKEAQEKLHALDKEIALFAVGDLLGNLREKYTTCDGLGDCGSILDYLNQVEEDIVERIDDFRTQERKEGGIPQLVEELAESSFDRYNVNVFVTQREIDGAPVVRETNPTPNNLIGRIDHKARFGFMSTDHNMLKAGAVHRANGGYLILQILDVLLNPFSWDALKRVLRAREGAPENVAEQHGLVSVATLKPQPIPLNLKVVLVGSPQIYNMLCHLDEDFRKLFKVKADFDIEMKRTPDHVDGYATFVGGRCRELDLLPFDKGAVARIIDYGSRLIEDKERLSAKSSEVADIISESAYWGVRDGGEVVRAEHVQRAIEQKIYRSRMIEDKIQSLIEDGTIMVDVAGETVGQANGLSIYDLGDYNFGRPSRLTCRVAAGRGKIVDIQRESELGGRIHSKGVMTLAGYLGGKYGATQPVAIQATLAFEQLYEEVEGDSASSTELYVLLSALSELPIKQGIAVTGSVDQFGRIQPIGGVNAKIEGFYEVCKAKGLDGSHGVMIPSTNIRHLMLKEEVIDVVREGRFNIWAVENVDQGIEILTGTPAGEELPEGGFPEGSVHALVTKRLRGLAEVAKELAPQQMIAASSGKEPAANI